MEMVVGLEERPGDTLHPDQEPEGVGSGCRQVSSFLWASVSLSVKLG